MLSNNTKVHFIGIGGIGMSALAQVLLSKGYIVTGSDLSNNTLTQAIEAKGGKVFIGHKSSNIGNVHIVIYSSAVPKDNPEMIEAKKRNLKILHRGELLAELMKEKSGVAVTGAHGKTTTASMISEILLKAGYDPTCILGGESINLRTNAYAGKGRYLVAEADESDGTHLYLEPSFGIITNIDLEHLDYYKDAEKIYEANLSFLKRIQPEGMFFGLIDDKLIRKMLLHYEGKFATFGLSSQADLSASNIELDGMSCTFDCIYHKKEMGRMKINVPGKHNILNALAACLFALHAGVGYAAIKKALLEYRSTRRRFEIYNNTGGITLIEDYAHHPTEITATLAACRLLKPKRIVAVFQPHRYTRTRDFAKEFGNSLSSVNELILTNIYAASEDPIKGVSVKNIFDAVLENGLKNAHIMPKKSIAEYLYNTCRDGDLIAVLGAGDIGGVAKDLGERLSKK